MPRPADPNEDQRITAVEAGFGGCDDELPQLLNVLNGEMSLIGRLSVLN